MQQHTTWCANARNMLGPTMLRAFARALKQDIFENRTTLTPAGKQYNVTQLV